ncbi:OmpL47-type beta-barrel domain-containing protein [Neobacillus sp. SAB-20_R2A]|uniref:OmpL47-type beta-barrel domain-containing protein n=1 Tax=Neobacillus sp. SAB-20_R2A TaxID=3120519 RepID=UPI003C6E43B2
MIFLRKRRNLFAKLTTLILLFSLLSPVSKGVAAGDVTPPKLASLSLSGTSATQGQSIRLSAEILEEESGVDVAYAYYDGPVGYSKTVYLSFNSETSKYEGSFDVSTYDGAGVWELSSIYLKDKQGNKYSIYNRETPYQGSTYEYRNLSQYNIEVYGTLIDDIAPRLGDLSLSSTRAAGGESITVSADIIEEGSGVEYAHLSFVPPNGDSEGGKPIDLIYNQETGKYEGTFYADPYDVPGIWSIGTIQLGDKLYNYYTYRNGQTPSQDDYYEVRDFSAYNIEVYGTVGDLTAPALNGFSVSKTTIMQGEQVQLSADIVDDLSGVDHVYVSYKAPVGNVYRDVELTYNAETLKYEGIFGTNPDDPAGTWPLYSVETVDKKGNFYTYYNSKEDSKGSTFEHRDLSQNNILVKALDTSAPETLLNVQGQTGTNSWYGSGVTVSLTASDNDAGIEKTLYRINGGEWQPYAEPFSLTVEGTTVVEYKSIDKAGNEEDVKASTIKIDTQKPDTKIGDVPSYPVKVDVPLSFLAQDGTSGIARTEYSVNGGNWITYQAPTYVRTEGTNTVEYRSIDMAGNVEEVKRVEFVIDKTAPATTTSTLGTGWYNSDVEVSLTATDSISGVAKSEYRLNGGSWTAYTSPVRISGQGINTLEYRSIDKVGNVEATKQVEVKVDKTAPTTTTSVKDGWYNSDTTVSLVSSDSHSGIAKIEFRLNGGAWATYTGGIVVSTEGNNTLEFRSVDVAGNTEEIKTVQVKIDKTNPLLNVTFNPSVIIGNTGKLINVKAAVDAWDALSGIASFELVSITSSQPDVVKGGKIPEPDIQGAEYGTADTDFYLRNEISGSDRIYTITYKAIDNAGNSTVTSSTILVKKK